MPGRPAGGESAQPVSVFTFHLGLRMFQDLRLRDEDDVGARDLVAAETLPQQPLGPIARHRIADPAGCGKPEPSVPLRVVDRDQREERTVQAKAFPQDALELRPGAQPLRRPEARARTIAGGYAPIRLRPF
jgi:hypothetical protein